MKLLWTAFLSLCATTASAGILNFGNFHDPNGVNDALNQLVNAYPSKARLETITTLPSGRAIKAIKISSNPPSNDPAKGDVVFVAEHHAREWISVEMALYLADELLARYNTDPVLKADMDALQVWIVPLVNPDGFAYTWDSVSGNRYWRKNRTLNSDGSYGVDLNRNWGFQWGLLSGSSNIPSYDTYHGTAAFSEPETAALQAFLAARTNLKCLVTYHSFSELYLRPWSYTTSDPPGEQDLQRLVQRAIARIAAVHGHTYQENIWYTSSGEATDYIWNQWRDASFTPELRPAASCPNGLACFAPAASEIAPTNEENWPAANALIHDAARTGVWIADYPGDSGAEPSAVWTSSGWSHAFWESPDISTTPSGPLTGGSTVTLSIHVRNNTGSTMHNVTIDAAYTDPRITLEFPSPTMVSIGSQTVNVPSGGKTITMPWTVPTGTNSWGEWHWCVGVVVHHDDDMPLTTQVQKTSNVACRNFQTTPMVMAQQTAILILAAENYLRVPAELNVRLDPRELPQGWTAVIGKLDHEHSPGEPDPCGTYRKAMLLKATGPLLEPGGRMFIPIQVRAPKRDLTAREFNVRVSAALLPLVPGARKPVGNGFTYHIVRR